MSYGNDANDLVVHGDLGELAYANWSNLPKNQLKIVDSPVYLRTPVNATTTGFAASITTTYYTPILLTEPKTISQLSVKSGAGHSGTTSLRMGIWSDLNGLPANLLQDAGLVSMIASSTNYASTFADLVLPAGLYWVGCNAVSASGTLQLTGSSGGSTIYNALLGALSSTAAGSFLIGRTESYNAASSFVAAGTTSAATAVSYVWAKLT